MARRAARPASIREVLVETARRIAPWPSAARPGPSIVDQALAGVSLDERRKVLRDTPSAFYRRDAW